MKQFKSISVISRIAALIALLGLFAFIVPKEDDPLDKLLAALQKWTTVHPQEKVYLQMDKPYYALGDTIWFKGYLTVGSRHQLSAVSGSVYVDLINEQDSLIRSLKLPATSGMVIGDFVLGDEMKEGNYRIRAYTQWMRNAGEEYFFDKTFTIGSVFSNNIVTKADYQYKDVDGKQVLTATLNYTDDQGKPLADKNVQYRIFIDKKLIWVKSIKTDAQGNIPVNISNEKNADLAGAYIRTVLSNSSGKDIVKDFPIKASLSQSDVQFFPESGNLVNGVVSRVAFKAIGVDGLGINITGKIIDNENKELADISTLHAGMGSFSLRPESNKTYTAKIKFADGSTRDIALPKANDNGYVLGVYQPNNDSILVRIYTSAQQIQQANTSNTITSINLVAQTGGEVIAATTVKITGPMTSVWVDKKAFPTGIAQFSIFNNTGEALNERVAFIRGNDQMKLDIKTAKTAYKSKDPVFFTMDSKDGEGKPTIGNYSVSVIDESKIPVEEANESTIFSNLLLTSDIKGYVEQPNYYFTKVTADVNKALDNLMLTQGYRRFTWKELNNTNATEPKFAAEGLGVNITGKVLTLSHKPMPNAKVTLLALKAGVTRFTTSDSLGRFRFDGFFMTDSVKLTIQARSAKNSDKLDLILDSVPKLKINKNKNIADISTNIAGTHKTYLEAGKKQDEIFEKAGLFDRVQRLREVRISSKKEKPSEIAAQGMFRVPEGASDQTLKLVDAESCATLYLCLLRKLPAGVNITKDADGNWSFADSRGATLALIINGRKVTDGGEVTEILEGGVEPTDVVRIEVIRTNQALISYLGSPAVMLITRTNFSRKVSTPGVVNVTPKGFNRVRDFYSPKYSRAGGATLLPDVRSTVYWNPYLKTGTDGKATFGFFNADGPGTYKVIVEGINADGQLGRQVYRYQVEEGPAAVSLAAMPSFTGIGQITAPIDSFNQRMPLEKVYLHTDKPYYNIGDTIWFKSYVTDAALNATKQSGLLYVELCNDTSEVVRRVCIPIKDGIGMGQIPLPKSNFSEGGFTIRAYTNWMQNFGPDAFFSQRFYLGLPSKTTWLVSSKASISKAADNKDQLDIDVSLKRGDKSALALRDVEVKVYEGDYYFYNERMRTGVDGTIKFSKVLKNKLDTRKVRIQITSLEKIDNGKILQIPLDIKRPQLIDLQFLPEGGNLIAGLKSTLAFKSIGEDGKGINVSGVIYDARGIRVTDFTSSYNGMGVLDFTPRAAEIYTAKIISPAAVAKTYNLPKTSPIGTVLHIDNPEQANDLTVKIAGLNKPGADTAFYLIGTNGGRVYYSQHINVKENQLTISKKMFPSGIARFTLFNGQIPLNERVVFIDHQDRLSINIKPNKAVYAKRDSVGLDIEIKDQSGMPVRGSFSVAVTDNGQVKTDSLDNYSIAAGLLLKSGLKGTVETPAYYLNRQNKQAWQNLDNLMLTQGWTGYNWGDVFAPAKEPRFKAEKELEVFGKVINVMGKPVAGSRVLVASKKPEFTTAIETNDAGEFKMAVPNIDSPSFFLQATKAQGGKLFLGDIILRKFKNARAPATDRDRIKPWFVNPDSTQLNYIKRAAEKEDDANIKTAGTLLKNVNIKKAKIIPNSENPYGPGRSDLAFDEADIKQAGVQNLYELLRQKIPGFKVVNDRERRVMDSTGHTFTNNIVSMKINKFFVNTAFSVFNEKNNDMDLAIDGRIMPMPVTYSPQVMIDYLSRIEITGLKGVEVMYSRKFTVGSINRLGTQGLSKPGYRTYDFAKIEITTTLGVGSTSPGAGTAFYRPLPMLQPQQFYSPKYAMDKPAVGEPDYRSTVYWNPDVNTDASGKAKVSFYTTDLPANYTLNIQGVTADGNIGNLILKMPANGTKGNTSQ